MRTKVTIQGSSGACTWSAYEGQVVESQERDEAAEGWKGP